ncbi:MAG: sugar nucleotide-binding protein [Notoacmeibacter sp.]|nr:sugar nucleotide-binding protein [Notoacmeibacter sp.]
MRIVVTGARGFVGQALVPALEAAGHAVVAPTRHEADLADPGGFRPLLDGADALVHLAGHNPPRWKSRLDDRQMFRALNVDATAALGRIALEAGVGIFVFLSSARVYGIQDLPVYGEDTPPRPADAYGASKWQAEQALTEIFAAAPQRLLVFRAPVIYRPGRGGVLGLVERFARSGLPFPEPFAIARKSVLYRGSLVSALCHALARDPPLQGLFNICDGEPVTLGELGAMFAAPHNRRFRTPPAPRFAVRALSALPVIGSAAAHLAAPCVLDCGRLTRELDWMPVSTHDTIIASLSGRSGGE